MPVLARGTAISKVTAYPGDYPLGHEVVEPAQAATATRGSQGERVWIYVYNDSVADIAAYQVVARKNTTSEFNVLVAPTGVYVNRVVGVTQHIIATGYCGFVLKRGRCTLTADAAVTQNKVLIPDASTAGSVESGGAGAYITQGIGDSLGGASGAGTFTGYIDCRY